MIIGITPNPLKLHQFAEDATPREVQQYNLETRARKESRACSGFRWELIHEAGTHFTHLAHLILLQVLKLNEG